MNTNTKANSDTKKPVSEAKQEANRNNAKKSTGPKTLLGKKIAAMNAVRHGLRSKSFFLLPTEKPSDFDAFQNRWREELKPADEVEAALLDLAVQDLWKLDRCERAAEAAFVDDLEVFDINEAMDHESLTYQLHETPRKIIIPLRATL